MSFEILWTLQHECRRKDLLQSHSQISKELIHDHALGHVSILDKLQIEYISSKKRLENVKYFTIIFVCLVQVKKMSSHLKIINLYIKSKITFVT